MATRSRRRPNDGDHEVTRTFTEPITYVFKVCEAATTDLLERGIGRVHRLTDQCDPGGRLHLRLRRSHLFVHGPEHRRATAR